MNNSATIKLQKGEIKLYEFGDIKVHAYITRDPVSDVVVLVEKSGMAVMIDPPCFKDNIKELSEYTEMLGLDITHVIVNYHMAGASMAPHAKVWSTKQAQNYGKFGIGKHIVDDFTKTFGEAFDPKLYKVTDYITDETVVLADMWFRAVDTIEAFNVEIPEINCVCVHMLSHDEHSIISSMEQAEQIIEQLRGYIDSGVELILSGHHAPETTKDALAKVKYLKKLLKFAKLSKSAVEFKSKMNRAFSNYGGAHYLDMTAGFLFES